MMTSIRLGLVLPCILFNCQFLRRRPPNSLSFNFGTHNNAKNLPNVKLKSAARLMDLCAGSPKRHIAENLMPRAVGYAHIYWGRGFFPPVVLEA